MVGSESQSATRMPSQTHSSLPPPPPFPKNFPGDVKGQYQAFCSHGKPWLCITVVADNMPSRIFVKKNIDNETLKNLMMSWYFAGYYTGLYEGQQQARGSQ